MADRGVHPAQSRDQRTVLSGRHGRDAATPPIGSRRHRDAGAGMLGVARHRVMWVGVEPGVDLVAQCVVRAFLRIVLVQLGRNAPPIDRVQFYPARHDFYALGERGQVCRQPRFVHQAISIRRQQDAIRPGEPRRFGHGEPAGHAGIGIHRRKVSFEHVQSRAGVQPHGAGQRRRGIGAVIGQQHDVIGRRADLPGQSLQAAHDAIFLVPRRDRHHCRRSRAVPHAGCIETLRRGLDNPQRITFISNAAAAADRFAWNTPIR